MSVRLFIGNLPYAASEAELREHLSSVGVPSQVVLPVDRETGRPRGFAFVDYADRAVAEEAIRRYDQQPFKGRPLAVSEARPPGGGSRNRNFGPDAPPKNKRKPPRKDERGPKGPIKERPVGRLYDADEDWRSPDEDKDVEVDNVATSAKDDDVTDDDK
ncbi:MAG: RNA-binding protein [Acidobacteria bacterium]|nr:RNA-binding protein [Acidobacteriota bacterium]